MAEPERWLKPRGYPWATGGMGVIKLVAMEPIKPKGEEDDEEARQHSIFAFLNGAHILSAPKPQSPHQAKKED